MARLASLKVQDHLFSSWKEIASYLGKGVRTVQRWELERGLPVLRPEGMPTGIVSISWMQLDRWVDSQQLRPSLQESIEASRELRKKRLVLLHDLWYEMERCRIECRALTRSASDTK